MRHLHITPTNDINTLRTSVLIDDGRSLEKPPNWESVVHLEEPQYLTEFPTQHMTATWGN
jgi:hypothetical protein